MDDYHIHALPAGLRLNQYEVIGVLGSGGFGITYLAHDVGLDLEVAIKEYLPDDLATRSEGSKVTAKSSSSRTDFQWGLERFLAEARVLAKFRHPNIVRIFQVFEANNTAYIVMEYAKGESLSGLIQKQGTLSEEKTKSIIFPVLQGLKRVHHEGFLHRDIKPGNIILRDEGGPVLIDFGAARQAVETKSRSITSIITEGYAPLEQYDPNGNQGPWTDVHALAAVSYKCLTGKTPPAATSRVRNDPLVPVSEAAASPVSPAFAHAIEWALAVYEDQRPQTVDEFWQAVETDAPRQPATADTKTRVLPREPSKAVSASRSVTPPPPQQPQFNLPPIKMLIGAGAGLALVMVALLVFYFSNHQASPQDTRTWQDASKIGTIASYDGYLREEPNGYYADQARDRMHARRDEIDKTWQTVQHAKTSGVVAQFMQKYGSEGIHLQDARTLHDGLYKAEEAQRETNKGVEKQLQDVGIETPMTGDAAETTAAIQAFQKSQTLPATGKFDDTTAAAVQTQSVLIRKTRAAYLRAAAIRTRAGYENFLMNYPTSPYGANVRSRLAQCHFVSMSQATARQQPVQMTSKESNRDQNVSLASAQRKAQAAAFNSCSALGGSPGPVRYLNEVCTTHTGPLIGPNCPFLQHCTVYDCTSTASLQCTTTAMASQPHEICP